MRAEKASQLPFGSSRTNRRRTKVKANVRNNGECLRDLHCPSCTPCLARPTLEPRIWQPTTNIPTAAPCRHRARTRQAGRNLGANAGNRSSGQRFAAALQFPSGRAGSRAMAPERLKQRDTPECAPGTGCETWSVVHHKSHGTRHTPPWPRPAVVVVISVGCLLILFVVLPAASICCVCESRILSQIESTATS